MSDFSQFTGQIIALLVGAAPYLKLALSHLKSATKDAVDAAAQEAGTQTGGIIVEKASKLFGALRNWFQKDENTKGQKILDLVEADPADEHQLNALAKQIQATLAKHPEWANEIRPLLQDDASQEIIAKNKSQVEKITMTLTGAGQQRINADESVVKDVKMNIKRS